ncbi:DUF7563 family protein [Natrinema soli]|uniref:DUF7563 family protein n=1 Tax=Natrinema soli TaxID=1930624 RepID=UPI003CCD855C
MAECDNCGAHITDRYKRVFAANDGTLRACSNCCSQSEMFEGAGSSRSSISEID